jgi:hypothetical protein
MQLLALKFEIFGNLKTDLDRRGRERFEHPLGHERINGACADRLTARSAKRGRQLAADIPRLVTIILVGDVHASPAPPASQQAAEQGRAAARNAAMPGAVCGHLLLVPLEGAPVNVSRPALPMQHRPRLQIAYEAPPAVRLARQPQASLLVPPAIDIGARIGWMTQHIGKGGAVRSIPSHLALARSGSDPVR